MASDDVDVWWTSVGEPDPSLVALLDEVERRRLDKLRRPEDRQRFVLGASILRLAVASHADVAPGEVRLDRTCERCGGPHGKVQPGYGLQASVSHSGSVVAVAIREGDEPLGVDVEAVSDAAGMLLEVAPDVLAAEERDAIDRLPHGERVAGLLRFWTRKEAGLKATGDGLRLPMRDLVISGPLDPPAMRQWVQRPELVGQIWLHDLDLPGSVATSHIAALAGLGRRPDQVRLRDARLLLRVLA